MALPLQPHSDRACQWKCPRRESYGGKEERNNNPYRGKGRNISLGIRLGYKAVSAERGQLS